VRRGLGDDFEGDRGAHGEGGGNEGQPDTNWCKHETGTAYLANREIRQEITVSDNQASTQTITKKTTICGDAASSLAV
jgi:hypothetical protein